MISVIMVNFNGEADLPKCLSSVFSTDYPNFEVVVVDNGSRDGSRAMLQALSKNETRLKIVLSAKNLGFAEANNLGYKSAEGEFIVLLNCDTVVSPCWLNELVRTMKEDKTVGVAQSKLLCLYNPEIIDSTGDLVHPSGSSISRGMGEKDLGQYDNELEIFSARGAAVIIRRSLIEEIGLFDPAYFMSYEDIDLGWRARLAGYRIKLAPKSIVYHRGFDMYNNTWLTKMFNTYKNHYMTLLKNYETRNLLRFMPEFMTINFLKIFTSLIMPGDMLAKFAPFTFRLRLMLNVIKAPLYIIKNFPSIWAKRMHVQSIRKIPDKILMNSMSQLPFATFILTTRVTIRRKSSEYLHANKESIKPTETRISILEETKRRITFR